MRKIIDDQPDTGRIRLSVPAIYDQIKKSNSSLNRKPKKLLEDSLERVLEVVKSDVLGDDEEDSVEGDFEGLEEPTPTVWRYRNGRRIRLADLLRCLGTQWRKSKHCRRVADYLEINPGR